jgi:hypothetical protein
LETEKLSFLASEEKVKVIFAFNEILYNNDLLSEPDFIKHITKKITSHANTAMAKEWKNDFINAKTFLWPESFISKLNSNLGKYKNAPAFVLNNKQAKYIMVVHTFWMDFGFDMGLMKRPAKAHLKIYFYKASDPVNYITVSETYEAKGLYNESRFKNSEYPKPSLATIQNLYQRIAPNLSKTLKKVVK